MNIPPNSRVAICGFTGCGKSLLAATILKEWLPHKRRIFIYDPVSDSDPTNVWGQWGEPCYELADVGKATSEGRKIVRLATYDEDAIPVLSFLACNTPDCCLVLDESASLLPSNLQHAPEDFSKLLYHGRHWGASALFLGQHYSMLPVGLRIQSFCFLSQIPEGTGRDWAKERNHGQDPPLIPDYHWLVSAPSGQENSIMPPVNRSIETERVTDEQVGTALDTSDPEPEYSRMLAGCL